MPTPLRPAAIALSLGLGGSLIGCASTVRAVDITVVNATAEPVSAVTCWIGEGRDQKVLTVELEPAHTATFSTTTDAADPIVIDVVWTAGVEGERIELGEVDSPGATVRLLGPGQHTVDGNH